MKRSASDIIQRVGAHVGFIAVLLALLLCAPGRGLADDASDAKKLIDQAEGTLKNFMNDPDIQGFSKLLQGAAGVYIVPRLTKGAFIFGIEGGNGVVLARDAKTDTWSEPLFYETSAVSFGLQAGAQSQEAIVLIMTPKGMDRLLSSTVKLGVDGSVAIGPKGGGVEGTLADFVTFTRAKGLYAGVSFDGASIRTRDDLNAAYFGEDVRPSDIIIAHKAKPNPNSKELQAKLATAGAKQ
jgi:lipid-binding SYLF domain-containing protein